MINESNSITSDEILEAVEAAADEAYEAKVELVGRESFSAFERSIMLQTLDRSWREHLAALDHLRQGIHLRGYAQKNPKQEYKREAFELFAAMLDAVKLEVTRIVMNVQIQSPEQLEQAAEQMEEQGGHLENVEFRHAEFAEASAAAPAAVEAATAAMIGDAMSHASSPQAASAVGADGVPKVGRNDPCPCGSGKKYKQCHGKIAYAGKRRASSAPRRFASMLWLHFAVLRHLARAHQFRFSRCRRLPAFSSTGRDHGCQFPLDRSRSTASRRRRHARLGGGEHSQAEPQGRAGHFRRRRRDGRRRLHAEPLLRGAGHRVPRESRARARRRQADSRARGQHRQRERGHRRTGPLAHARQPAWGTRPPRRHRAGTGAAVFDRRDS